MANGLDATANAAAMFDALFQPGTPERETWPESQRALEGAQQALNDAKARFSPDGQPMVKNAEGGRRSVPQVYRLLRQIDEEMASLRVSLAVSCVSMAEFDRAYPVRPAPDQALDAATDQVIVTEQAMLMSMRYVGVQGRELERAAESFLACSRKLIPGALRQVLNDTLYELLTSVLATHKMMRELNLAVACWSARRRVIARQN